MSKTKGMFPTMFFSDITYFRTKAVKSIKKVVTKLKSPEIKKTNVKPVKT